MTTPLIDLLQQIASGITIYEPYPRTSQALVEFQDLVHRLQEMERLGLVTRVWTQVRQIAGSEYYDMAMVTRGLTEEGERVLAEHLDGR
jgi:hypothetical protein